MVKQILSVILPLILPLVSVTAAQAVELTDEQRAAIEARIQPVGEVCVQGDNCGGMPAAAKSSTASTAATGQDATSTAAASGGMASVATTASAPAPDGEATYNMACVACHASGAAGAPIVGNADAWAPRIAKGMDALYDSGLNGIAGSSMLAKGGRADLSDEAVIAAVDYMVANSQ